MIFNVVSDTFNELVPVTDGSYYTRAINETGYDGLLEYQTGDFALCFYGADGVTPGTPTAGTITPLMSPVENIWLAPGVGDTSISATTVTVESDGIATYNLPMFIGGAIQGRIDLSGITGATFVKAQFRRFR